MKKHSEFLTVIKDKTKYKFFNGEYIKGNPVLKKELKDIGFDDNDMEYPIFDNNNNGGYDGNRFPALTDKDLEKYSRSTRLPKPDGEYMDVDYQNKHGISYDRIHWENMYNTYLKAIKRWFGGGMKKTRRRRRNQKPKKNKSMKYPKRRFSNKRR